MQGDVTLEAEDDAKSRSSSSSNAKGLDSSFDCYTVRLLADYLKGLAVMGSDECTSQCIIMCPHLLEKCFERLSQC